MLSPMIPPIIAATITPHTLGTPRDAENAPAKFSTVSDGTTGASASATIRTVTSG